MYRYWRLKRMHVNKTHVCFSLTGWASTNVLVTAGGLRKDPHLGGEHLTIEGRKQCDTRESWYGGSFF